MKALGRTKKKRRVRWGRVLGALILLWIFMIGAYNVFQYIQKTIADSNKIFKTEKESIAFQGEIPEIGTANILLLGSDSRGGKQARTDTIMVANYNQDNHTVKLISFMRDMYVSIPGHGMQKLNAAYTYGGPELLRQTLKDNFDLDITYYAIADFKGFEKAVDILVPNGIEVDVPYDMSYGIGLEIEQGRQVLHGKELLGYVRFRHDRLSDFGRVQRQQEVLTKLKEESINMYNVAKLPELLGVLNTYVDTNMDTQTMLAIGKDIVSKKSGTLKTLRIPENGTYENSSYEGVGKVLELDFEKNRQALNQFLESGK